MAEKNRPLKVFAVVLVGGKGKRLRPITTLARPKAFLPITKSDETMFKKTLNRIKSVIPAGHIMVVANKRHLRLVIKDFHGINAKNILLEPVAKNTGPAIAIAASKLKRRYGDAMMVVLPADHYVENDGKYASSVRKAIEFIGSHMSDDIFLVFGIKPTFPATGYGYIKIAKDSARHRSVHKVDRFVEKPDIVKARRFLREGGYFWNSGMFVFKASTILKAFKVFAPDIYSASEKIGTAKIENIYKKMPNISIDYAIMEKAQPIYCIEGNYGWQDVGTFESLKDTLERELGIRSQRSGRSDKKTVSSISVLEKLSKILKRTDR